MKNYLSGFKLLVTIVLFPTVLFSCQKEVDYAPQIRALQASRDSLASALAQTNARVASLTTNVGAINASIDSIKLQLNVIGNQIAALNTQISAVNADVASIRSQLAVLTQQYADLLSKLNLILAQLSVTPTSLSNGLMAWYPFTGNAIDSSGGGNNGTVNGATLTTDRFGVANRAYSYNGSSNYISLSNPFFNGTQVSTFSVSVNFYLNQLPSVNNIYNLWSKNGFWQGLGLYINNTGQIGFWGSVTTYKYQSCLTNNNIVSPGTWNNLIVVYNNTDCKIYLNGNLVAVTLETNDQGGSHLTNTMVGFVEFGQTAGGNSASTNMFGASNAVSTGNVSFMNGKIDEFRLYNRVINQTEISFLASH